MSTPIDNDTYTVCFSGTACTRDEGEVTRIGSDKRIYCPETGYIPVRIHNEISGDLFSSASSIVVRGVGNNDWAQLRSFCEPLTVDGPLKVPDDLLHEARKYASVDNQHSNIDAVHAWSATALALHGANLAAGSGAQRFNFIGHSRGAVESIMAAWFLYAYGPREIPVNIFAIDPVPGPGNWYGILTQLPPNVENYVGVYAWDHLDKWFTALVPRPNGPMTGSADAVRLGKSWDTLADHYQLRDPLEADTHTAQPERYKLYACRGRHGTVAGNTTADGQYDPARLSRHVAPVPKLVYKMARAYLAEWGTRFPAGSEVGERVEALRRQIHTDHTEFDAMGGGAIRTHRGRLVSASSGRAFWKTSYFEDVVGDPPYTLSYPVTPERTGAGWVDWTFL